MLDKKLVQTYFKQSMVDSRPVLSVPVHLVIELGCCGSNKLVKLHGPEVAWIPD